MDIHEEFLEDLEKFRATVELKKKNCLDTLEEIRDMVQDRKDVKEDVKQESIAKQHEETPNHPEETSESQEGRKFHVKKFGDTRCRRKERRTWI